MPYTYAYGAWSFLRSSVGDGVGVERSKARPIINESPVKPSADHSMYKCWVKGSSDFFFLYLALFQLSKNKLDICIIIYPSILYLLWHHNHSHSNNKHPFLWNTKAGSMHLKRVEYSLIIVFCEAKLEAHVNILAQMVSLVFVCGLQGIQWRFGPCRRRSFQ